MGFWRIRIKKLYNYVVQMYNVYIIIYIPYMLDQEPRLLNVSFCWKRRLQFKRGHWSRAAFISSR